MAHKTSCTAGLNDTGWSKLALTAILALAAGLRFHDIARTSLWYDEAVSWMQSSGSLSHLLTSVAADNYPPLHNLLLWLTIPLLGEDEIALRLPSAIASLVSVWLMFELGRRVFGTRTGLLAALLLAVSPFHIWYATEARMYAVFDMFGLAFLLCAALALQTGKRGWFIATTIVATAFLYSHVYALFSLMAFGVTLILLAYTARDQDIARKMRRLIVSLMIAGCLFLPWLVILATRAKAVTDEGFWIAYPDLPFLTVMVHDMAGSKWLFLLFLALAIALLIATLRTAPNRAALAQKPLIPLLYAFAFGAAGIAYLLSVTVQPILFDRYLISAWSVFLLLAAAGAQRLAPRFGSPLFVIAAVALSYTFLEFTLTNRIKPEWRRITEVLRQESTSPAPVILFKGFARPALDYYLRGQHAIQAIDSAPDISKAFGDANQIWLLIVHSSPDEMANAIAAVPAGWSETGRWREFGWGASGLTLIRYARQPGSPN
ncbi:glycosyltransferase family 39 protein [Roseibium sp.]|uniref:glycosyltransferase family 39 protein n=1 Tax=Roseibium sp. TaxID=1936156 RepID=UPI003A974BA0